MFASLLFAAAIDRLAASGIRSWRSLGLWSQLMVDACCLVSGVWGGLHGGNFIVNFIKRLAQKLRRIILLHFWQLLGFISGKPKSPSLPWFSDLLDVTVTPKTNIVLFCQTPRQETFKNPRNPICLEISKFGTSNVLDRTNLKIRLIYFWKSEIWDQYIPESTKWSFLKIVEKTGPRKSEKSV